MTLILPSRNHTRDQELEMVISMHRKQVDLTSFFLICSADTQEFLSAPQGYFTLGPPTRRFASTLRGEATDDGRRQ